MRLVNLANPFWTGGGGGGSNYSSFNLASVASSSINSGGIITPRGLYISDDGTKIFAQESGSADGVFRFDMSTAFDITTETFTSEGTGLSGAGGPITCAFSPDGLNYFTIQNNVIFGATLSTAWNTSTQGSVTTYALTDVTSTLNLAFNDDGTKCYKRGTQIRFGIVEIVLSTPYDVTSATSETTYIPPTDSLRFDSFVFVNNGLDILIFDNIAEEADLINLSTAWDVSTMSNSIHNQNTGLTIITGSSYSTISYTDDTNVYLLDSQAAKNVYQFSTSFI